MKKLIIAIDCDDVLVPTAPLILKHYEKTYGVRIELKDFYSKDLSVWGVSDVATAIQRVNDYTKTEEFQNAEPFVEAMNALRELSRHHELHLVTGRPDFLTAATTDMLARHFPGIFASTEFTNFFGQKARSKADVCTKLKADFLIEDHLHHATVVSQCGINVLLFGDYPWNQSEQLPSNIRRVHDWTEVVRTLTEQQELVP
jgi:uncharacterized HAD superfamily protein